MQRVELKSPYPEWRPGAHLGILYADESRQDGRSVLVVLGPHTHAKSPVAKALTAAESVLTHSAPGVQTLLDIVTGPSRLAWVYDYVDGIGAAWLAREEGSEILPLGIAAEIVGNTAQILSNQGARGQGHPGPGLNDIMIDQHGRVHVSGFVSPFPPNPIYREPHGHVDSAALVYRLGILLSTLVCGSPPVATSDEKAHAAMVRRVLIRGVARPGSGFIARYRDCLTAMIAWDPSERPPLATVPASLREIASSTGDPSLRDWSRRHISHIQLQVADPTREDPYDPWQATSLETSKEEGTPPPASKLQLTVPGAQMRDLEEEDDPTAESQSGAHPGSGNATKVRSRGVIPVGVGPPVEAIKEVPTLPSGFIGANPPTQPRPPVRDFLPALTTRVWLLLASTTALLLVLGLTSMAYLLLP
jgi:hypothetical protein